MKFSLAAHTKWLQETPKKLQAASLTASVCVQVSTLVFLCVWWKTSATFPKLWFLLQTPDLQGGGGGNPVAAGTLISQLDGSSDFATAKCVCYRTRGSTAVLRNKPSDRSDLPSEPTVVDLWPLRTAGQDGSTSGEHSAGKRGEELRRRRGARKVGGGGYRFKFQGYYNGFAGTGLLLAFY